MDKRAPAPSYGKVKLRKQGRYWHARVTYQGERRCLALQVTNKDRAMDKARDINDLMEKGGRLGAHSTAGR